MIDETRTLEPLRVGAELAALCESHQIETDWIDECRNVDALIARVFEECDRMLAAVVAGEANEAEIGPELTRVRNLLTFSERASGLRGSGAASPALVSGIEGIERLNQESWETADSSGAGRSTRALELLDEVARLCHQINNPLTSLMGRVQMLQLKSDPGPEQMLKTMQVVEESSRRVAALVQELGQMVCRGKEELLEKVGARRAIQVGISSPGSRTVRRSRQ